MVCDTDFDKSFDLTQQSEIWRVSAPENESKSLIISEKAILGQNLFWNRLSTTKFSKNDKQAFKLFQNFAEFFGEIGNWLKFFNDLQ